MYISILRKPIATARPWGPCETAGRLASVFVAFAVLLGTQCRDALPDRRQAPREFGYEIVRAYPHDPTAFTQGLVFAREDGRELLYEGTGLKGRSALRRVDIASGRVLEQRSLDSHYFGEGIALAGNRIYQLTWQSRIGFVYDRRTFEPLSEFGYPTEGWGLTYDPAGNRLILSDGSAYLYFLDPAALTITGRVEVRDDAGPVARLNELEWIDGRIYANVWQTDRIVVIRPDDGLVEGRVDLRGLLDPAYAGEVDVLNGIAYDAEEGRLFVTGKLWPRLFEIRLREKGN
jgi:glutamine cyclotransferase